MHLKQTVTPHWKSIRIIEQATEFYQGHKKKKKWMLALEFISRYHKTQLYVIVIINVNYYYIKLNRLEHCPKQ